MNSEVIYDYIQLSEVHPESEDVIIVKGYANKYKWQGEVEIDSHGSSFLPSAYELEAYSLNPVILYMHDVHQPVGKCLVIKMTGDGLYIEAAIYKDVNASVFNAVKNGVLNGFSIGIDIKSEQYSEILDAWIVSSGELIEISLVTTPSNTKSVVENVDLCSLGACQVLRTREVKEKRSKDLDKAILKEMVLKALNKD